ncbi:MAG: type II/IV secretion system protein [Candidatus Terrybacteria bacterium]|nr:type II/IV secretion system protein [Candidatus Terrybacteria bacterium]
MKIDDTQLKAFLLDGNLIEEAALREAEADVAKSGQRLGDALLARKLLTEEELSKLTAYILGVPFVDLSSVTVPHAVLELIPEPVARRNRIVPFRREGQKLEVAMLDPEDLQTIDFIRKRLRLKILPRLTTPVSIKHVLSQYTKSLQAEFGEIIGQEAGEVRAIAEGEVVTAGAEELRKAAEELPVVRIVDTLTKHAILQHASDIHIEPQEKEVAVRYRIDGILHDAMTLPKSVQDGIVARVKVLANLKLDEHRLPQDGRFKIETEDYRYSLRVSILPVFDGEKIVMRLLPETAHGRSLEELGFTGPGLESIHHAMRKTVGMILATGPTGSGKTTTLYAILEMLNRPGVNISTIEDPVEYRMPRVNQTQVRPEIGLTFANGLRSLVRQDPDIVMVGEIRDRETAGLAVNAALTGHLVLSTLHTNSASGAIPRLLDMGVEPFLISSTLQIVIAQRLVRRLCAERTPYTLSAGERKTLGEDVNLDALLAMLREEKIIGPRDDWDKVRFSKPKPASDCPDGYGGRVGIHEVLEVSETIRQLVNRRASADEVLKQARAEGMRIMVEDGILKAARGVTTIEEVLRVITE